MIRFEDYKRLSRRENVSGPSRTGLEVLFLYRHEFLVSFESMREDLLSA